MNRLIPLLLCAACIQKTSVTQATAGTQVRFVHWMETEQGVEPLPAEVLETVNEALSRRLVAASDESATTDLVRIAAQPVSARVPDDAPTVLVGCVPLFDNQVNGRFRWRIGCDVTVAEAGKRYDRHLTAVAHPVYYQQREAAALTEAAPAVRRELARVLESWLTQR